MSAFTSNEIEYLQGLRLGRLATIGQNGDPHVVPVRYRFNAELDTVDIIGYNLSYSKKWRDAGRTRRAAFVVDDSAGRGLPRGVEVRGGAELLGDSGSDGHGEAVIRIHPTYIVSWGIDSDAHSPNGRAVKT
ncbi:MAG TPA: PPOX class F420-dependent oxidoreductase [Chloroflexota bacterium]|nr:PPOX class F420-dependent oxidoreductase [Chloroflexota bacterium]